MYSVFENVFYPMMLFTGRIMSGKMKKWWLRNVIRYIDETTTVDSPQFAAGFGTETQDIQVTIRIKSYGTVPMKVESVVGVIVESGQSPVGTIQTSKVSVVPEGAELQKRGDIVVVTANFVPDMRLWLKHLYRLPKLSLSIVNGYINVSGAFGNHWFVIRDTPGDLRFYSEVATQAIRNAQERMEKLAEWNDSQ